MGISSIQWRLFYIFILSITLIFAIDLAQARAIDFDFKKGDTVILKLSSRLLKIESASDTLRGYFPIYVVNVSMTTDGKISVADKDDWQSEGWPMLDEFTFEKTHEKK